MKILKIFALPSNQGAIGHLRVLEPCKMLAEHGYATATVLEADKPVSTDAMIKVMQDTDILWYQGNFSQKFIWNILNCRAVNPKLKLVIDCDDNLYCVNQWNPSYTSFTTDDQIENAQYIAKLPKERNVARIRMFEAQVMESDALIVTNSLLASVYSHLNKNIYIMPNKLIWRNWHYSHIPKINDGKIRISWMGGTSHMMDLMVAHAGIKKVIKQKDNVIMQFQTSGECYIDYIRDFGKDKVEIWEWIDYSGHSFRMNCIKPDIGVIPLNEDEFSICKSDLKLVEYSVLKVPCVASNIPPYSKSIIHGVNGFLADNENDFEKYLLQLVNNPDLRNKMGEAAYDWAYRNRNAEKGIKEVYDMLLEIDSMPRWQISEDKRPIKEEIVNKINKETIAVS